MAVSRRPLHHKGVLLTGLTTNERLRTYRLGQAARRLEPGQSVSDVAFAVGFESLSYFAKWVNEPFGVSLSDYLVARAG